MPLPFLAAIPALLGGLGGAGGILGGLGGAGGILGMISNILPFGDMLGGIMKSLSPQKNEDSESKQDAAKDGSKSAQNGADSFLARLAAGQPPIPLPLPAFNLFG